MANYVYNLTTGRIRYEEQMLGPYGDMGWVRASGDTPPVPDKVWVNKRDSKGRPIKVLEYPNAITVIPQTAHTWQQSPEEAIEFAKEMYAKDGDIETLEMRVEMALGIGQYETDQRGVPRKKVEDAES